MISCRGTSLRLLSSLSAVLLITGCITRPISVESDNCYRATDRSLYTYLYLRLNADKTYKFLVRGHMDAFGDAASGTWEQEARIVSLAQTAGKEGVKFPSSLEILPDESLRFEYRGLRFFGEGADMKPYKCDPK